MGGLFSKGIKLKSISILLACLYIHLTTHVQNPTLKHRLMVYWWHQMLSFWYQYNINCRIPNHPRNSPQEHSTANLWNKINNVIIPFNFCSAAKVGRIIQNYAKTACSARKIPSISGRWYDKHVHMPYRLTVSMVAISSLDATQLRTDVTQLQRDATQLRS